MKKKTTKIIGVTAIVLLLLLPISSYILINYVSIPVVAMQSYEAFAEHDSTITEFKKFPNGTWVSKHDSLVQFQVKNSKVRIINNSSKIDASSFSPYTIEKGTSTFADSAIDTGFFLVIQHQNKTIRYEILSVKDGFDEFTLIDDTTIHLLVLKK